MKIRGFMARGRCKKAMPELGYATSCSRRITNKYIGMPGLARASIGQDWVSPLDNRWEDVLLVNQTAG